MTIFVLEKLIKEESLDNLKEFISNIKGSALEKDFHHQYGTANLANALEYIIETKTNKEVFQISFDLGLEYLDDRNLGRLITKTILSQKNDYYVYIKKQMDTSRFQQIQNSNFLTISSAFEAFPNSEFNDWIKLVEPDQEMLVNYIRSGVISVVGGSGRININNLDSYLSKVDTKQKEDLIYECLAWSAVGTTSSDRVCHLFNLILPEIKKPLLLQKLKKTLNLEKRKDIRLTTDDLEKFCKILVEHRPGNLLLLSQLLNSYNLSRSLNDKLIDSNKKSSYKSKKI